MTSGTTFHKSAFFKGVLVTQIGDSYTCSGNGGTDDPGHLPDWCPKTVLKVSIILNIKW